MLKFIFKQGENHAICPVMLGDAKLASQFADMMLGMEITHYNINKTRKNINLFSLKGEGIYVIGFSYPVVPKGKARIRVQISAAHTSEDIEKCINAFKKIGKKLNVIS